MSLPIDIVFLTQDLCFGGAQRQTLELAKRLNRSRFTPSIWTLSGPTDMDAEAKAAGVSVRNLGKTVIPDLSFPFKLFSRLLKQTPDILVPCTTLPNIWGPIAGRMARVPIIVGTCRGTGSVNNQHEAWLWRLCHHMVCNSMPLYNQLCNLGMPTGRLTYVPNGVDVEYFTPGEVPIRQREPLILHVGRLVSDKDQMTLLRAFARVLEEFPLAKLRIVGDGPQEFILRKVIEGKPYRGHVAIVGNSPDMRPHYAAARIFALSSIREGQPSVVMEAMAAGLPVVSTQVGGVPALVDLNITGMLSPCNDSVTLATHLCQLLGDVENCQRMGEEGRHKVERQYAFSAMVANHEKLFERLWDIHKGKA